MLRRVLAGLMVLTLAGGLGLLQLYRDTTDPVRLGTEHLAGLTLEQRAFTIADTAVAGGAPGAVLLLQIGDERVTATAGTTDKSSNEPIDPDTPLRIASVSKIYTAAIIAALSQRGLIDLDDNITAYLPSDVTAGLANADSATVRQLLNHTAGIPDYHDIPHYLFGDWTKPLTLKRTLAAARRHRAPFASGEGIKYSNMAYILAGEVAERTSGRAMADLIDETLSTPLDLSATYYGQHSPPGADLHGYGTELRPWADTFVFWEHSAPDAGVVASASDVAAVLIALTWPDGELSELGQLMLDQPFGYTDRYQRALGFEIHRARGDSPKIGHSGDVPGYLSFAYSFPDREAVIVGHVTCDCPDLLGSMLDNAQRAIETPLTD
ncbi:MAG: serine hydrolase domain-containing protein [Pseudomonadota bacterium]